MSDVDPFQDLIGRVRAGDQAAAVDLVRQYEATVRRVVRFRLVDARLGAVLDSMDVCQSVMGSFFVRVAAGQYDLRRPDDLITLRAQAALGRRARAAAVLTVVGNRDDLRFAAFPEPTRRVTLPSYATLDLSGGFTLLAPRGSTPGVDLTARIENALDERYEQAANYRSPGRTLVIGAAAHVR